MVEFACQKTSFPDALFRVVHGRDHRRQGVLGGE